MAPPIRIVVLFLCTLFLCQPSSSADQQEAPALVSRIAFGSCSNQTDPQPIWDAVIDFDPQVFIWLGDNIYGDNRRPWRILGKERTLGPWKNVGRFYPSSEEEMRSRYNQAKSNPGYTRLRLRRKTQVIGTWDDHDYGLNDAGKEFSGKVTNQKLMLDFLDEPQDSPRRKQAGVYTSYLFGPKGRQVKVILLDTRYHRDPLKSDGSILGDSQWQWLEKELTGTPSEITVIGSSIQVLPNMTAVGSPLLSAESWSRFPKEKARLFKLISDSKRSGVVFISGDVHFGEITRFDCGTSYPLYDVTSSGLTQSVEGEIPLSVVVAPLVRLAVWWIPSTMRVYGKNCRFSSCFYGRPNFGAIEINWDATPVTLTIEVRDVHGHPVSQVKVPLSELQPGNMHQVPAKVGEYKHHCTLEVDLHWLVQYRFAFLLAGVLSVLVLVLMLAILCLAAIAKRFCFPKAKHE